MKNILLITLLFIIIFGFSQTTAGEYTVQILKENSKNSDFGTSFSIDDKIIFSSARGGGFEKKWDNGQPFLDLYEGKINSDGQLSNIKNLSSKLGSKYHESNVAFAPDFKTVYFTRNNSKTEEKDRIIEALDEKPNKVKRGRRGNKTKQLKYIKNTYLSIYKADVKNNGKWENIISLPFNNPNYSVGHPTVSRDGKKLYFASDMPGSYGGTDIFYVDIKDDGTFSKPKNLGRSINTFGREMFPFIDKDNILYFASDGREKGFGNLDVFAVKIYEDSFSEVLHLPAPVNTEEDDFSLILNNNNNQGYFSSNRKDGIGDDDIYHFIAEPPLSFGCDQLLVGIVKDDNGKLLKNVVVSVIDSYGKEISNTNTTSKGTYKINVPCGSKVKITGVKLSYLDDEKELISNTNPKEKYQVDLNLTKVVVCSQTVNLVVENIKTNKAISHAMVDVYDLNGKKILSEKTSKKGKVKIELPCKKEFRFVANHARYDENEMMLTTKDGGLSQKAVLGLKQVCSQTVNLVVENTRTNKAISYAIVDVYDLDGKKIFTEKASKKGEVEFELPCKKEFRFVANKDKYDQNEIMLTTKGDGLSQKAVLGLKLIPDLTEIKILKNKVVININPIYFPLNSATITPTAAIELDKVVKMMNKYPKLKIEGASHTDSRGGKDFNQKLSYKRANSTVQYIINQGINPKRIYAHGYGETQPVNKCIDGVKCTQKEYQLNRRTEFIIQNPEVLGYY